MARQRRTPKNSTETVSHEPVAAPFLPTGHEPASMESLQTGSDDCSEISAGSPQNEEVDSTKDNGTETMQEAPAKNEPQVEADTQKYWVEESVDEPVDEPVDESVDEPVDESVDEPVDEPVDESVDEPVDESVDESVDEPVDESVDEPHIQEVSVRDTIRARQRAAAAESSDKLQKTGSTLKGIIASRKPQSGKITAREEIRNRQLGRKSGTSVSQVIFDRRYRRNN